VLRITIDLIPGGREAARRTIAVAELGRIHGKRLGTYRILLAEDPFGPIGDAVLTDYPRYGASVWDLVARGIAVTLTGKEELPRRPTVPEVLVHHVGNVPYVRKSEIPEPARTLFWRNMENSSKPMVESDADPENCAYLWDWEDFLDGRR
jgi:hypothetical protein